MEKKQCLECKEDIPGNATRCPYCRSWQSKYIPDVQSPKGILFGYVFIFVVVLAIIIGVPRLVLRSSRKDLVKDFEAMRGSLSITWSKMRVTRTPERDYVSIIGAVENSGKQAWRDIHFQAEFFDSKGELIDVMSQSLPALYVFGGTGSTFRITRTAIRPPAEYATHKVVIQWARRPR